MMTIENLKVLVEIQETQVSNYKRSIEQEKSFSNLTRIGVMESLLKRFENELSKNKNILVLREFNLKR